MGSIAKVKTLRTLERGDLEVIRVGGDDGAGNNVECDQYTPPGVDAQPLPDDYVATTSDGTSGGRVAVGFIPGKSTNVAAQGEHRTYARNSDGEVVAEVHLKNDGSVAFGNDNGSGTIADDGTITLEAGSGKIVIKPGGEIELNSASVDPAGLIEALDFKAGLIQFLTHIHTAPAGGGSTTPPIA